LVEGDGGFAQNLQEIGTAAINQLNLKIFILDDSGYASIRMTQKNYFGGSYVGCDRQTGLGLPNWDVLFSAWGVPVVRVKPGYENDSKFLDLFNSDGTCVFIVTIDPEQTYFPKITSRVTESGAMESKPLHLMSPDLSEEQARLYLKYLD
jgi:acetolactate synthase-1/2/3 large subunit